MAGAVGLELTTCGFGDRCSSQLSYTPANSGSFNAAAGTRQATLLGLLMHCVLTLKLAVFLLFETTGSISFLLGCRIVPAFALGAFQCNNFTHLDSPCRVSFKTHAVYRSLRSPGELRSGNRISIKQEFPLRGLKQRCGRLRG